MEIRQLSNFVRIVDAGSLTRAANEIGIAQPALSIQIARLEQELGCRLLIRSTRGVQATESGMILYREVRDVMRKIEQIPRTVRAASTDPSGNVSVGFPSSLSSYFSSLAIEIVRNRFPEVKLQIFEGSSAQQRELIANNRLELALLCEAHPGIGLCRRPLFNQRLAFFCDGSDPQDCPGQPITFAEAAVRIVGMPPPGNPIRTVFEEAASLLPQKPKIQVEWNSMRMLLDAVKAGLGPSINLWLPLSREYADHIVLRPIVDAKVQIKVSLCRAKSTEPTTAALLVENALSEVILQRIAQPDWRGGVKAAS